jgi:lipid A 3-O-deacylase
MSVRATCLSTLSVLPLLVLDGRADTELPPPEFHINPGFYAPLRAKLEDDKVDVRAPRVSLDLDGLWTLSPQAQFGLGTGIEQAHYRFFNLPSVPPGVVEPIRDAFQVKLTPRFNYSLNERWTLVTGARLSAAGDPDAEVGQSLTYGGYVGARRKFSEHFALTFGAFATSRLEDSLRVLPLLGVEWQISQRWRFATQGLGGQLSYALRPPLRLFFGLSYETREYRLADDSSVPGGVLRDQTTPITLGLEWQPNPTTKVTVALGRTMGTSYRLRNEQGNTVFDRDAQAAPFVSLGVDIGLGGSHRAASESDDSQRAVPFERNAPGRDSGLGGSTLQFWEENDSMSGTDDNYSQGAQVAYLGPEYRLGEMPGWLGWFGEGLPALGYTVERARGTFTAGQLIFTPLDIRATALQVGDHPYAGWLYGAPSLERRGRTSGGTDVLEQIRLGLGWVGPGALGGEAQNFIHRNFQINQALGWKNQLRNEPTADFTYARAWRVLLAGEREGGAVDFIPHFGLVGGTPRTQAAAGGTLRFGVNLPDDFGQPTIQSMLPISSGAPQPFGVYLFAAVEGRAVARDTFLDGNLWHSSYHVESEPLDLETRVGFAVTWSQVDLGFTYARQSQEYKGQGFGTHDYGSIWLNWRM